MNKSGLKALVKQYTLQSLKEILSGMDFENMISEVVKVSNKPSQDKSDLKEMILASRKIQEGLIPKQGKVIKLFDDPLLQQLAEDTVNSGHKVIVDENKDEPTNESGISEDVMVDMGLFNKDYSKLLG